MDNTEHIIQELRSEKWEMAQEIERLREQERKMTNHALERMEEIERLREALMMWAKFYKNNEHENSDNDLFLAEEAMEETRLLLGDDI